MSGFHAIVPAGGAGTRLWPLSRAERPKFLLDLTGAGRSLLQQTWDRLVPLTGPCHVHVVTGRAHADAVAAQLPQARVLAEPSARDSMPAIGLAVALIAEREPEAVVGSFAADHLISDVARFHSAVDEAVAAAQTGKIVTIGLRPTSASTAFGYIDAGAPLSGLSTALEVRRFVEKPDATTAAEYVASGTYWWNAGMFVMRCDVLLGHLERLHPPLHEGLRAIAAAWETEHRDAVLERWWPRLTQIAIDHAVAEPVSLDGGVAVIPGDFDWTDLGDFATLAAHASSDDAVWVDGNGFVAARTGQAVSVVGIEDAVVVVTEDAVLVTNRSSAQQVKDVPRAWGDRDRTDLL